MVSLIITVIGLSLFEVISSIDNAIINAEILSTMGKKARRWFLSWGLLFAVFVVRGVLPWLIIWLTAPQLGPMGAFSAALSGDPSIHKLIEAAAPPLLVGGGTFLIFLFFHWLFLEPKNFGLARFEKFFSTKGVWFYATVSILLTVIVYLALQDHPLVALGAVVGSTAFFIMHGFKQNAEQNEAQLLDSKAGISDISKLMYLEIIDLTFSIDGVLGAFAFTLSVPLILIGNGIGALVVRKLTMSNIDSIKRYAYIKNGAMYSVLGLGCVMLLDGFGAHIPSWLSPLITALSIGYFFAKSRRDYKRAH